MDAGCDRTAQEGMLVITSSMVIIIKQAPKVHNTLAVKTRQMKTNLCSSSKDNSHHSIACVCVKNITENLHVHMIKINCNIKILMCNEVYFIVWPATAVGQ